MNPTPSNVVPPEDCICASFWTVRRKHKSDCPLSTPTNVEGEIQDFMDNNKPTRFYQIVKKYTLALGKHKLEIRILRDE